MSEWQPSDGDTKCQQCHEPNGAWFADNELWNAVVSDRVADWLAGEVLPQNDPGGCLCPRCFMLLAAERGVDVVWRLMPEWSGRAHLMNFRDDSIPGGAA